ncbi:MAG TPA: BlaI/MecI/CopY family transcriptional regulator [Vicinamibacterales bacterium]|nr:BlaI/MecI/CopY family transcriptional regulator [Vicinamibacterales bacterium]
MTDRNISRRPLTELQQAILELLWDAGPATSEQVRTGLLPKHRLKDSSVRTLLRRLESRGFLTHTVEGQAYVYRAAVPQRRLAARAVQQIIERFCSGSVEQFLLGMVDEKVLSASEIRKLARKVRGQE